MSALNKSTQKFASHIFDEATYQVFSHFTVTSIILFAVALTIGVMVGSVLAALAVGSFVWALLAVGCAKYCEMVANQRGHIQS